MFPVICRLIYWPTHVAPAMTDLFALPPGLEWDFVKVFVADTHTHARTHFLILTHFLSLSHSHIVFMLHSQVMANADLARVYARSESLEFFASSNRQHVLSQLACHNLSTLYPSQFLHFHR